MRTFLGHTHPGDGVGRLCATHGGPFALRAAQDRLVNETIGAPVAVGSARQSRDLALCDLPDSEASLYQHVLMAELTETIDQFLGRFARKAIPRLVEEGGPRGLLAEIRMAARLREAIDRQISSLIRSGMYESEAELDDVLGGSPYERPTWKEIGEALGVTAQAAHRKYSRTSRKLDDEQQ
jgi:hypothetical protein